MGTGVGWCCFNGGFGGVSGRWWGSGFGVEEGGEVVDDVLDVHSWAIWMRGVFFLRFCLLAMDLLTNRWCW